MLNSWMSVWLEYFNKTNKIKIFKYLYGHKSTKLANRKIIKIAKTSHNIKSQLYNDNTN